MTKGKNLEADYFNRENAVSKERIDEEKRRLQKEADKERLRDLHYMKCPQCGHDLEKKRLTYVDVDQCPSCGVLVLKAENIDGFVSEERSLLKPFIDFFKS